MNRCKGCTDFVVCLLRFYCPVRVGPHGLAVDVRLQVQLEDSGALAELPRELGLLALHRGFVGSWAVRWCADLMAAVREHPSSSVLELDLRSEAIDARLVDGETIVELPSLRRGPRTRAREGAALRSDRDLARIATALSHDLRQPLQVIKMFGELGKRGADSKVIGQQVIASSEQMSAMLRGLMELVQIKPAGVASCDFLEVSSQVMDRLAPMFLEAGASWQRVDGANALLHLSSDHLRILLRNLVENALRFREPDRPLLVRLGIEADSGGFVIALEDNGQGIPADQIPHIFGLFSKVARDQHGEGVGAGLAIVDRIVELAGGAVEVRSEQGTRVEVWLPGEQAS